MGKLAFSFTLPALRSKPRNSGQCFALGKFYGQAERPISTGKLHALPRFHPPPIKVVVFDWPS